MANEPVLKIEGLHELQFALKRAGEGAEKELVEELRNSSAVFKIMADAKARMAMAIGHDLKRPARSKGHAAEAIKTRANAKGVSLVGGKSSVPYFGWLDFGGVLKPKGRRFNTQKRKVLRSGRSIYPAVYQNLEDLRAAANAAADRLREKAGL